MKREDRVRATNQFRSFLDAPGGGVGRYARPAMPLALLLVTSSTCSCAPRAMSCRVRVLR
eukprot:3238404-Prymnesium_polylepis.1